MADEPTGTPEVTPVAEPPAEKLLTQAQVDVIVQDRLARDRKDRPSDDEIASLREKAARFDELDAASKTELEKANERAAKAEADGTAVLERATKKLVDAEIKSEAAGKFIDPTDAFQIDRGAIEFDSEGNPTNVGDLVSKLLEAKPHLAVASGGSRGNADQGAREGGAANQLSRESLKTMSSAEIIQAQKEGRLEEMLGRR